MKSQTPIRHTASLRLQVRKRRVCGTLSDGSRIRLNPGQLHGRRRHVPGIAERNHADVARNLHPHFGECHKRALRNMVVGEIYDLREVEVRRRDETAHPVERRLPYQCDVVRPLRREQPAIHRYACPLEHPVYRMVVALEVGHGDQPDAGVLHAVHEFGVGRVSGLVDAAKAARRAQPLYRAGKRDVRHARRNLPHNGLDPRLVQYEVGLLVQIGPEASEVASARADARHYCARDLHAAGF